MRHFTPLFILCVACGSIETTPLPEDDPVIRPPADGLAASGVGFREDPYAPGSSWYSYDGTTHAITPRAETYGFTRGESAWLLRVDSYYDRQGRSGILSFALRARAQDGSWSAPAALTTSANIKQGPVCLDLDALAEAPCDSEAEVVLRTDWRVVPPAGFAVANPAIYALTHHADAQPLATFILDADAFGAPDTLDLSALKPAPDAARDPLASRVGWLHERADEAPRQDVQLQATANMELVQWQLTALNGANLSLAVRCAPLASTQDAQASLADVPVRSLTITVPASGGYVRLCGDTAGLASAIDDPRAGRWPDTKTFDLIVEQRDGRLVMRPAPGQLLHNWTRGAGAGSIAMDPAPAPPAALWE
jgi:hypothetical protein